MFVPQKTLAAVLRLAPVGFLIALWIGFGVRAPRFLTPENVRAVLVQSSSLMVVALGVNFALLAGEIDLSVGSIMYLAAVIVGLGMPHASPAGCLLAVIAIGTVFGAINGAFVVRFALPSFIVTLAMLFVGRGLGLLASSTRIVYANAAVADLGRAAVLKVPVSLWLALGAIGVAWLTLNRSAFGPFVRCVGADADAARRVGVPTRAVRFGIFALSGAFAGLGGFISFSQTSAASSAFGEHVEFLAIAGAVLGGTSLFGGRGNLWAPVVGSLVIVTVQDALVRMNANPYAYPVITGALILSAALFDSFRVRLQNQSVRRSRASAARGKVPTPAVAPGSRA